MINKWILVSVINIGYPHCIYTTILWSWGQPGYEPFLNSCTNYYYTGISQKKTSPVEYFFSFGLAEILSDTVHRLFPQHQCCKHTVRENTDQCCPYGNSTPGHSVLKMSLFQSSLPLWLLVYLRKNFCGIHNSSLSAFQFTVLISSDLQWLAKLVLVVQLWTLHKISDQKKNIVEGEWWTVGGVWPHGYCTCLWMSSSLGSSPGWGHCAVFWDTTLISLYPGV